MDFQPIDLTTVSYRKRELVMYPVQKQEFDILASGYSSIHLALFGIFFGTALTSFVTFESVPPRRTNGHKILARRNNIRGFIPLLWGNGYQGLQKL
jgi:hypothetical protein